MQSVSVFTDQILKITSSEGDNSGQLSSNTSVGVVIKKYWSRLTKLNSAVKHSMSEVKNNTVLLYNNAIFGVLRSRLAKRWEILIFPRTVGNTGKFLGNTGNSWELLGNRILTN